MNNFSRSSIFVISCAFLALFSLPSVSHAATVSRYWVGGPGNWNDTARWSTSTGGAGGASVPVAGQEAHFDRFSGGGTVTVNAAVDVSALHLSSAYTGSIMQTSNTIRVGTGHILVGSGRIIGGNAVLSLSGSYTQTGGIVTIQNTFALSGSLSVTNAGSVSPSTSFTSTGTTIFEGKADQNLTKGNNATLSLKTLTLNNTGAGAADDLIVNMSGGLNLSGALTVTLGNLDLDTKNMVLRADGGLTLANAAQATLVSDAAMSLSGTVLVNDNATFTVSGSTTVTLNDTGDQSVDFDGQVLQSVTVNNTGGGSDDDVTIAGGGLTLSGSLTVTLGNLDLDTNNQALIIESNATLADAAQVTLVTDAALRVGGNLLVNDAATLTMSGNNTLTLNGTADQTFDVDAQRLRNVTINNSGGGSTDDVIVAGGGLNFSGTLTISLGNLDLDANNQTLSVSGSITLTSTAQATLVTDANVSASGSVTVGALATATFSGSMTLTLDGIDQNIDVNNGSIPNLTIASGSGSTLTDYLKVTSTLQINAGSTISLGSQILSGTSATITNLATIAENSGKIVHTATNVLLADSTYAEKASFVFGDLVYVTLTDSDENIDGTTADTVSVTIGVTPDSETVILVETTVSSGIFRNSLPTAFKDQNINAENGTLEAGGTSTLTLSFVDAQDALGNADTATLAAAAAAASATTTTTATSSGGGGGGGGSRRGAVLSSQGVVRRQTAGNVIGGETEGTDESTTEEGSESSEEETSSPWSDFDLDDPHADAAMRLYQAGIVKGNDDGTVHLNRSLSRVESLTLLVRTLGAEEIPEGSLPFSDIDPRAWYAGPLKTALDLNIIKGFPDGTFRPGESLNLVQSLKIISIALGFADQGDESIAANWFDPYITVGREAGLIRGEIMPARPVSRGEFFEWLALLLP